jgi:hypothetical protein
MENICGIFLLREAKEKITCVLREFSSFLSLELEKETETPVV